MTMTETKNKDFVFSNHAEIEMKLRKICKDLAMSVLKEPEQIIDGIGSKKIYQSRVLFNNEKSFLLRVIVNEEYSPAVVITTYRTSKIEKYWRIK